MNKIAIVFVLFAVLCSTNSYPGEIRIYDANDQFIGILVSMDCCTLSVFVPTLKLVASIVIGNEVDVPANLGQLEFPFRTFFTEAGCMGTAGILEPVEKLMTFKKAGQTAYGYGRVGTPANFTYSLLGGTSCTEISPKAAFPIVEVPAGSIPFTLPIAFPIRYEYDGGQASACKGDLNGNGVVDGSDLALFVADFGKTNCSN